jgi:uncharacterized protein (DUF2235 family)
MSKNVVICCDGTANEFAKHNTNVVKLYSTLVQDPARQVTYYHPGIGTMEPAGALTTFARKVTKGLGMAIGHGLAYDIRDAYVFLMRHYQPDDKVYLFGFSRGAYTVRAVASLLYLYGLLPPGNEPLVLYAIRMMTGMQRARAGNQRDDRMRSEYFELASAFKATIGRTACRPHFVGVWDTVSSVGWVENPLKLPYVTDNPDIAIGRHAVALDERRAFFRTHLWRHSGQMKEHGPRDLKQVWFPGVHSDVGGGYPEAESGLAKIALEWMLNEAEAAGLLVDRQRRDLVLGYAPGTSNVRPDPSANAHESLRGWWNLAEFVPKRHYDWKRKKEGRRMNAYRYRTVPEGALVHDSVYAHGGPSLARVPANAVRVS